MSYLNSGINIGLEAAITLLESDEDLSKEQIIETLKSLKREDK